MFYTPIALALNPSTFKNQEMFGDYSNYISVSF